MKPLALAAFVLVLAGSVSVVAGECAQFCTDELAPVCGSNGATYLNDCELQIAQCQINSTTELYKVSDGKCNVNASGGEGPTATPTTAPTPAPTPAQTASASCKILCTQDEYPQCGWDGTTYKNACEFARAQCQNPNLVFRSKGACPTNPPTNPPTLK